MGKLTEQIRPEVKIPVIKMNWNTVQWLADRATSGFMVGTWFPRQIGKKIIGLNQARKAGSAISVETKNYKETVNKVKEEVQVAKTLDEKDIELSAATNFVPIILQHLDTLRQTGASTTEDTRLWIVTELAETGFSQDVIESMLEGVSRLGDRDAEEVTPEMFTAAIEGSPIHALPSSPESVKL